jgi:hypothetical protein
MFFLLKETAWGEVEERKEGRGDGFMGEAKASGRRGYTV